MQATPSAAPVNSALTITIALSGAGGGHTSATSLTFNNAAAQTFAFTKFQAINIATLAGDDKINLPSNLPKTIFFMTIDGGDGNDLINGSNLNDSMIGGNGNDTVFVDDVGDKAAGGGGGGDLLNASVTPNTAPTGFEF